MRWSESFTALFVHFAEAVSRVGSISLDEALHTWTPLYLNLAGLDRSFDPLVRTWQEYLTGLRGAADPVAWTHRFYLEHSYDYPTPPSGCFSWSYEEATRSIRFHFYGSVDASGYSPLSEARRPIRMLELETLFAEVQRAVPEALAVRGRSWLYNVPSYCRLFPPEYVHTAVPVEPELQFMSLWGQFLDRSWSLRRSPAEEFQSRASVARTLDDLRNGFPSPVRAPRCAIKHFYRYYNL